MRISFKDDKLWAVLKLQEGGYINVNSFSELVDCSASLSEDYKNILR